MAMPPKALLLLRLKRISDQFLSEKTIEYVHD